MYGTGQTTGYINQPTMADVAPPVRTGLHEQLANALMRVRELNSGIAGLQCRLAGPEPMGQEKPNAKNPETPSVSQLAIELTDAVREAENRFSMLQQVIG